jgi:hypothetical protein
VLDPKGNDMHYTYASPVLPKNIAEPESFLMELF